MGADQNLINSVKRLGPSRLRDDSGWISALTAIGDYVAVKKQQFNEATKNVNSVTQDIPDVGKLGDYKAEVDGLLKTMKNVPAFMPKYKKAVNRYNEIMSNFEGTKSILSLAAKKKLKLAGVDQDSPKETQGNISDISIYESAESIVLNSDIMQNRHTTEMTDDGPKYVFRDANGVKTGEILVKDWVDEKVDLVSDSQSNIDVLHTLIETNGANAKINGVVYAEDDIKQKVTEYTESMWRTGSDKTNILFNTPLMTSNGSMTFMDYYASQDKIYVESMRDADQSGEFLDYEGSDANDESRVLARRNILKKGMWDKGEEIIIKEKWNEFVKMSIDHMYNVSETRVVGGKGKGKGKQRKVGANGYVRNYALSEDDSSTGEFDPRQEWVGTKTPDDIDKMAQSINSGEMFRDWFNHLYIPIKDENNKTVAFNIELESGTTIPNQISIEKVRLNLIGSGKLDTL
tara:strand:- start:2792 stop:4171 length:1380 start_codon:yes stop_codon:yes gene_type:complete